MKASVLKLNDKEVKELSLNELIKTEGGRISFPLPDPPMRFPFIKRIPFCVPPFRPVVYTPVKRRF